jgi:hypothetical protein
MADTLVPTLTQAATVIDEHIKDGRFQRSLALVTAVSSLASGLEVTYEHYKGSYSNPVMYTPVILSGILTGAAIAAFFSRKAARTVLRWTALTTLVDGMTGFVFHIRGIQRKPGGWRLPLTNIIMGPPIFAPLLFGTAAYLGFLASYLRREEDAKESRDPRYTGWRRDLHEGRFQKHLCTVAAFWTVFSGVEAWYSHYKSRFRIWSQWTPVILSPIQLGVCVASAFSESAAKRMLAPVSMLTLTNGVVGFGYHARGIVRRSGGMKHWLYNILYGPPIFAPLLFSACGFLGVLASLLRREGHDGNRKQEK